jgi:hypothetical protein
MGCVFREVGTEFIDITKHNQGNLQTSRQIEGRGGSFLT